MASKANSDRVPSLTHPWQSAPSDTLLTRWECPKCLLAASGVPPATLCPDMVAAALDAAEARGRKGMREEAAKVVSLAARVVSDGLVPEASTLGMLVRTEAAIRALPDTPPDPKETK
jgi:hypothetical protein